MQVYMPFVSLVLMYLFYAFVFPVASWHFVVALVVILIPLSIQIAAAVVGGAQQKRLVPQREELAKRISDLIKGIQLVKYFG